MTGCQISSAKYLGFLSIFDGMDGGADDRKVLKNGRMLLSVILKQMKRQMDGCAVPFMCNFRKAMENAGNMIGVTDIHYLMRQYTVFFFRKSLFP